MTASIRAFDCLNPRLLSAQPWELLRISLGWARGAHEQCANSDQPSCLVCWTRADDVQNPAQGCWCDRTCLCPWVRLHGQGSAAGTGWSSSHPHHCGIPLRMAAAPPFVGNRQAWPPRGAWLPCVRSAILPGFRCPAAPFRSLEHHPACRRSNVAGWSFGCVHWARSGLWALTRCLLVFCRLHPSQLWT